MPIQKKTVKKRATRKKAAPKTTKKKAVRKKAAPTKSRKKQILPNHQELIDQLCQVPAPSIKDAAAAIDMKYEYARKLCIQPHIADAIEAQRVKITKEAMKLASVTKADILIGAKELFDRCMQAEMVRDREGMPTGEWQFDSSGAARALKLMGDHIDVNAFKALDDDGKPIDQNWQVTIVGVDGSKKIIGPNDP